MTKPLAAPLGQPIDEKYGEDCGYCGQPLNNGWNHGRRSGYGDFESVTCFSVSRKRSITTEVAAPLPEIASRRSRPYDRSFLKEPVEAIAYLSAALDDSPESYADAVKHFVEANQQVRPPKEPNPVLAEGLNNSNTAPVPLGEPAHVCMYDSDVLPMQYGENLPPDVEQYNSLFCKCGRVNHYGTWIPALATKAVPIEAQWWLTTLDMHGNPTLLDGAHSDAEGCNHAAYLIQAMRLPSSGKKFAVARVELFECVPSAQRCKSRGDRNHQQGEVRPDRRG